MDVGGAAPRQPKPSSVGQAAAARAEDVGGVARLLEAEAADAVEVLEALFEAVDGRHLGGAHHLSRVVVLLVRLLGAVGVADLVWRYGRYFDSNSLTPDQYDHCVSVSMFILITPHSMARLMSLMSEPEPPWKTKETGLPVPSPPSSLSMNSFELARISGSSSTFPGAYTPCTLPKAAATVNFESIGCSALYTSYTSSGFV